MFGMKPKIERLYELQESKEWAKLIRDSEKLLGGKKHQADLHRLRITAFCNLNEHEKVVWECHAGAKCDPEDAVWWHNMAGQVYVGIHDYKQAMMEFDECRRADPNDPTGPIGMSIVRRMMGSPKQALQDINKVIMRWPTHARAHAIKGDCLVDLNRPEMAMQCYEMAMHLDPRDAYAQERRNLLLVRELQKETEGDW